MLGTGGFRKLKHKSQDRTVMLKGEIRNRLNWDLTSTIVSYIISKRLSEISMLWLKKW